MSLVLLLVAASFLVVAAPLALVLLILWVLLPLVLRFLILVLGLIRTRRAFRCGRPGGTFGCFRRQEHRLVGRRAAARCSFGGWSSGHGCFDLRSWGFDCGRSRLGSWGGRWLANGFDRGLRGFDGCHRCGGRFR